MNRRVLGESRRERRARERAKEQSKSHVVEAMLGRRDLRVGSHRFEGRVLMTGAILVILTLGLIYWWYQGRISLRETFASDVVVNTYVHPVTGWQGVEAEDAPGEMRACFLFTEEEVVLDAPVIAKVEDIAPPDPPGWFKCFNVAYIRNEIARGAGTVYLAASNEVDGLDRVVALLPGNRGFMWRQPHPKNDL